MNCANFGYYASTQPSQVRTNNEFIQLISGFFQINRNNPGTNCYLPQIILAAQMGDVLINNIGSRPILTFEIRL